MAKKPMSSFPSWFTKDDENLSSISKKTISPRVQNDAAKFYIEYFSTLHSGAEYALDIFPLIFRREMAEIKGKFSHEELSVILNVSNGDLESSLAGNHIIPRLQDAEDDYFREVGREQVIKKIKGFRSFSLVCLEIWASGFWAGKEKNLDAWIAILE